MDIAQAIELAERSPHTFTIQYPPSRHYFREHFATSQPDALPWWLEACERAPHALLYVHVPFCAQRCFYCNFAVDVRRSQPLHARYIDALITQLERLDAAWSGESTPLSGIDIGGGTPTQLAPALLERLMHAMQPWLTRMNEAAELSIETTPRVAAHHPEKLAMLRDAGVTRISMGLQSTNDETLASVNRRQQRTLATESLAALTSAGFARTSVDLVFGLPGQTSDHLREDLHEVIAHGADTITLYDCLYRGQGRALPGLVSHRPTPVEYAAMYDMAWELLNEAGYVGQYGGVNFSRRPGELGTSSYFTGRLLKGEPYVGVGNYASSLTPQGRWWFAAYEVDDYIADIESSGLVLPTTGGAYVLPAREHMAKHILANLNFGVVEALAFQHVFGESLDSCFGKSLTMACDRGWLVPTSKGYAVAHGAFAHIWTLRALFYAPEALDWVREHLDLCS